MINRNNPSLAINGGSPVSADPVIIHKPYILEDDMQAVYETTKTTFVSGDGPACREFEKKLSEYLGVKHVFFLNSCTGGLELAFKLKHFPKGSEVIVPDFTYTSTALGPLYNDLKIILADVNPENGNFDIDKLESYITDKTVAIMPVDYAGNPADMDPIMKLAEKYNLFVVHDTAQSIGAEYKGKKTGCQGHVSTFSFHGTKNITTGEGGAIVTDDDELAEKIKILREKGTDKYSFLTDNVSRGYYEYVDIGNSYVQSNILGAMGVTQLNKIDFILRERAAIADFYTKELHGIEGLKLPCPTKNGTPNWHIYYVLVPNEDKYWVLDALRAENILVNVHYTPLHRNRYYQKLGTDEEFPGSMEFFGSLLRLPIYPSLTQEERQHVVNAVKKVFGE